MVGRGGTWWLVIEGGTLNEGGGRGSPQNTIHKECNRRINPGRLLLHSYGRVGVSGFQDPALGFVE